MVRGVTDLKGTVALITGGNGGIGLGMATGLAEAGADIAIWGRNAEKNEQAVIELEKTGRRVHTEVCDVGDEAQVVASFAATVEELGAVDSVFANAGISGIAAITDMTLDEWQRVMRVNLDGTFLTFREAARYLVARAEGGALVAVSSMVSNFGAPRQVHYAASKTGVLGLVRSLAVELARHDIRVNALLPGWTDTDMLAGGKGWQKFVDSTVGRTPVRRWGTPEDMAAAAVFLADKTQTFHTGDTLLVDGAYSVY